ncbi:ATP-binding protein [uncultured Alistipes sp.]|uniref:sensor histidine kinase n=1 Tax=uncultured Alistipes sp. TaxID=538949 RepID=UPI002599F2CE|nr:ATP-binding protein [uncultured Alistipes sp.]
MGTGLRSSLSYHRRLFLLLLAFSWALVACFIVFQYGREKQFKAERLDTRLQLFNLRMLDALADGATPEEFIAARNEPFGDLRVTVIDDAGRVTFDNSAGSLPETNHLDRPEVAEALARGTGFTIRRHSESTDLYYFYSAMSDGGVVVRSAVPYSITLREVLAADREFLWFMLGVTLLMSVAAYFATRRLGHNITRLRDFAQRAERGERIDEQAVFPHDELGDISSHIIRLYARLQRTTADRDREHALALHEQQEKIRIKKQLTNNINHELKTPVAAIQGYLETLLDNPGLGAEKRTAFLEKSCAQVARLRSLLADISTVTRMDEASQLILRERVVLNDIVDEIRADMQLRPEGQRLRVNCDFPYPLEMEGSPSLLGSVFRNLADNAAAYSGGRDIFIRLLDDSPEQYTLEFSDNGIGVEEEHLPHIFERFYRIDKGRSRKLGGTGLGLAIVKNAVIMHGGTISVRNSERGGLEFIFTLRKHS